MNIDVQLEDLYIGYRFTLKAILKNGTITDVPNQYIRWETKGSIKVENGIVTALGQKGDVVIATVISKTGRIVGKDEIYIG